MSPINSYPKSLQELSIHHIEGDHLLPFVAAFAKFFANNDLPKSRGTGVLDPSTKKTYSKAFKGAMHSQFPTHPYLRPGDKNSQGWTNLTARFSRSSEQAALKELSQYNLVKSTALYRDTNTNVHADDCFPSAFFCSSTSSSSPFFFFSSSSSTPPSLDSPFFGSSFSSSSSSSSYSYSSPSPVPFSQLEWYYSTPSLTPGYTA